jgi:hypothetical protein
MVTEVARRSFLYQGPELWFRLDDAIKKTQNLLNSSKRNMLIIYYQIISELFWIAE